jgi:hypothetical protein
VRGGSTHLESLVLQDALDGRVLARGRELGLEDDAEGAIAHDLALGILHVPSLSRHAILDLFADDLWARRAVSREHDKREQHGGEWGALTSHPETGEGSRPILRHGGAKTRRLSREREAGAEGSSEGNRRRGEGRGGQLLGAVGSEGDEGARGGGEGVEKWRIGCVEGDGEEEESERERRGEVEEV